MRQNKVAAPPLCQANIDTHDEELQVSGLFYRHSKKKEPGTLAG